LWDGIFHEAITVMSGVFVHPTAIVEDGAIIGSDTKVWAFAQIRPGARIGRGCNLGRNAFVDVDVEVGDNVKIQNNASLYEGVTIESGVFVGPHAVFTNDKVPRAITPTGSLKDSDDWELGRTVVRHGAAIGAGAVIVTGVEIGRWAMVGSGTVVTRDVPEHALVVGNPGRIIGFVSAAGKRFETADEASNASAQEAEQS
jgi:UDP-2-acetamido-3-amino-2,3-dideoxy-glucuronate N-acetyltransferase